MSSQCCRPEVQPSTTGTLLVVTCVARAEVSSGSSGKTCFQTHSGCWQDSVPCSCRTFQFLAGCWLLGLPASSRQELMDSLFDVSSVTSCRKPCFPRVHMMRSAHLENLPAWHLNCTTKSPRGSWKACVPQKPGILEGHLDSASLTPANA